MNKYILLLAMLASATAFSADVQKITYNDVEASQQLTTNADGSVDVVVIRETATCNIHMTKEEANATGDLYKVAVEE